MFLRALLFACIGFVTCAESVWSQTDTEVPLRVSGGEMMGRTVRKVMPDCPGDLWAKRLPCEATLLVLVREDGTVVEASALHVPSGSMEKAAVNAIMQWRFRPYVRDGRPRRVLTTVGIHIHLNGTQPKNVPGR